MKKLLTVTFLLITSIVIAQDYDKKIEVGSVYTKDLTRHSNAAINVLTNMKEEVFIRVGTIYYGMPNEHATFLSKLLRNAAQKMKESTATVSLESDPVIVKYRHAGRDHSIQVYITIDPDDPIYLDEDNPESVEFGKIYLLFDDNSFLLTSKEAKDLGDLIDTRKAKIDEVQDMLNDIQLLPALQAELDELNRPSE